MTTKNLLLASFVCAFITNVNAQTNPAITSWKINQTGATGYGNIPSNVQQIQYSANNVYVSCSGVPDYTIGPWNGNPNVPKNQNFIYKITLNPAQNTGTLVNVGLGHIGVWSNGVSVFNAKDAMSYQNQGIWNQNAIVVEGPSFDNCLGHPAPNGEYHHHLNPTCLYDDKDSTHHSPIIGFAFDGFPIYGAYSFSNTDGTGNIKRMKTSYRKRNITERKILPNGNTASSAGPAVSVSFPLGYYVEDFEFITGLGDLDLHNGRFCVTPEYPSGIYAYFVTIDDKQKAEYPYTIGPIYYGTVQSGNIGPNSGHNVITESVTTYNSTSGIANQFPISNSQFQISPNPTNGKFTITLTSETGNPKSEIVIYNILGQIVYSEKINNSTTQQLINLNLPKGIYLLKIQNKENIYTEKIVIE